MVDTDDTRHTTDDERRTTPRVWHKLPTGELKNDCQIFIRHEKTQIMVKYESCILKEDIK